MIGVRHPDAVILCGAISVIVLSPLIAAATPIAMIFAFWNDWNLARQIVRSRKQYLDR